MGVYNKLYLYSYVIKTLVIILVFSSYSKLIDESLRVACDSGVDTLGIRSLFVLHGRTSRDSIKFTGEESGEKFYYFNLEVSKRRTETKFFLMYKS